MIRKMNLQKEASLPKEINLTYVKSPLNVPSILEKRMIYLERNLKGQYKSQLS